MTRVEGLRLLELKLRNKNLIKHSLAVEACMNRLAEKFGQNMEIWRLAGLLHDLDYEDTKDDFSKHGFVTGEILQKEGIDSQIIEKLVSDFAGQYDEYEIARELANSRRPRYKGLEPLKVKRRLYDYLRRRGFSHEVISEAINRRQTK